MNKAFVFRSKLTCIIVLAAIVAMASPVMMAAQDAAQKPLVLVFTATFASRIGLGPSMQYEFQAEGFLPATKTAMAWGKEYCPQNVLVSLVPKLMGPQETLTATFAPRVGLGPSMQYEFQVPAGASPQEDSFLRTVRAALAWGDEYCPQNILVVLLSRSQPTQETGSAPVVVTPAVRVNPGLAAPGQFVFTAKLVSRDSGLAMQREVKAGSLLRAAVDTLTWNQKYFPDYVLYSMTQN